MNNKTLLFIVSVLGSSVVLLLGVIAYFGQKTYEKVDSVSNELVNVRVESVRDSLTHLFFRQVQDYQSSDLRRIDEVVEGHDRIIRKNIDIGRLRK